MSELKTNKISAQSGSSVAVGDVTTPMALDISGNVDVAGVTTLGDVLSLTPGTAPVTPSEGDIYYDSAAHKLKCHNGTAWQDLF